MRILQAQDASGWITAIIAGRWVQAKVYDRPSGFGVNEGRVSKIVISTTDKRGSKAAYHYDRGLDFDDLDPKILAKILEELEAL